jgi:hypothetical protein
MPTYRGACGHVLRNPGETWMDDRDTLLIFCVFCGRWVEPRMHVVPAPETASGQAHAR